LGFWNLTFSGRNPIFGRKVRRPGRTKGFPKGRVPPYLLAKVGQEWRVWTFHVFHFGFEGLGNFPICSLNSFLGGPGV